MVKRFEPLDRTRFICVSSMRSADESYRKFQQFKSVQQKTPRWLQHCTYKAIPDWNYWNSNLFCCNKISRGFGAGMVREMFRWISSLRSSFSQRSDEIRVFLVVYVFICVLYISKMDHSSLLLKKEQLNFPRLSFKWNIRTWHLFNKSMAIVGSGQYVMKHLLTEFLWNVILRMLFIVSLPFKYHRALHAWPNWAGMGLANILV